MTGGGLSAFFSGGQWGNSHRHIEGGRKRRTKSRHRRTRARSRVRTRTRRYRRRR